MPKIIRLFLGLLLLVGLAFATSPVFAAESQDVDFLGATFRSGLVLYFSVPDGFDWEGADKNVIVDGISYGLDCHVNAQDILACFAGVKAKSTGQLATIAFGDYSFATVVPDLTPEQSSGPNCDYQYNVFDYGPGYDPWGVIGTHCQSYEATLGDQIDYFNPKYNFTSTYKFLWNFPVPGAIPNITPLPNELGYWTLKVPGPVIIEDEICLDVDEQGLPDC